MTTKTFLLALTLDVHGEDDELPSDDLLAYAVDTAAQAEAVRSRLDAHIFGASDLIDADVTSLRLAGPEEAVKAAASIAAFRQDLADSMAKAAS